MVDMVFVMKVKLELETVFVSTQHNLDFGTNLHLVLAHAVKVSTTASTVKTLVLAKIKEVVSMEDLEMVLAVVLMDILEIFAKPAILILLLGASLHSLAPTVVVDMVFADLSLLVLLMVFVIVTQTSLEMIAQSHVKE